MREFSRLFVLVLIAGLLVAPGILAGDQPTLNLEQLCGQADKIFRGTVFESRAGSIQTAGGELPTITYTIRVDEAFQGDFSVVKGQRVVELTTVGSSKVRISADQVAGLPLVPAFTTGRDYLLFTTGADTNGLTGTVGADQGCFQIVQEAGQDRVMNLHKNHGLFAGMGLADEAVSNGQASYAQVSDQIRAALGQ